MNDRTTRILKGNREFGKLWDEMGLPRKPMALFGRALKAVNKIKTGGKK